jgi:hypothetical protein
MSLVQDPATGTAANVAPASTAPTAGEAALVVSISPNCTVAVSATAPTDRIASGSIGALNANVAISAAGIGDVGVTITGTWSATLTFQGTIDATNWFTIQAMPLPITASSTTVGTTTTNGQFTVPVSGLNQFRVIATAFSSGSATVTLEGNESAATTTGLMTVQQATAGNLNATVTGTVAISSGTVTANQGTPNSEANAWPMEITDGTHGPVAVKAASTAAAAADPSLVVALSPNSPVPAGTNIIGALSANQSVNLAQVAGTNTITGGEAGALGVGGLAATGSAVVGNPVLVAGSDGTDARTLATDSSGHPIIVGDGTAGSPAGGVVSVQGVSGGTVLPENLTQIAGNAVATAASGVLKTGIVGNAGATLDATLAAGTAPTDGLGVLAQYNTTQPAPTNTQTISLQSDQSGNLLEFPGVQTKTGAAWTSGTTVNTLQYPTGTITVGAPLGGEAVLVQLDQTTTITGGAVTFQGTYDGTNWVTIPIAQVLNPQTFAQLTNPYTFAASSNVPFLILLQGFQQIRLNLTTVITGSGSVTPYWTILAVVSTVASASTNTNVNIAQVAGTTTVTGGEAGALGVGGLAAAGAATVGNPVLVAGTDGTDARSILTDASGRQEVVGAAAAGAAVAGNPVLVGGSDGTDARTMATDSSGHPIIVGDGTAGTPAGGVVSVQGVSGGTTLPVSGTVTANQGTANTVANSWPTEITDGTHGPAAVKAASTAAAAADPSLVVALSPNSPIPSGANVIGAVTQSGTWTVTATSATASNLLAEVGGLGAAGSALVGNPVQIGGSDGTNTRALLTDTSGRQNVVGAAASGSAVAGNPVLIGGSDGTDARTISTDASGHVIVVGDGTAGTPAGGVVSIQGVAGGTAVPISGSITASGTVTANQGTANTLANAWPTELTDGTHGPVAVKAASTPAAAADASLVVALSPNSPLPAGAAVIGAVTQSGTWTVTATSATAANFLAEVGGLGAAGSALVGNPVQVAGSDGTNTRTLSTSNTGNLITENKPATTSSITSVASSATTVSLLASNANRLAALITNDGTGIMFVALAATASTTAYTYRVTSDSQILVDGFWTGAISAIWTSPNGSARITELTP